MMALQELGPTAADIRQLRTELDELLRARQYAAQRERRLTEAVRNASEPDLAHGYAQPQRHPDPELVRQLGQARALREGLGARCLDLSERLLSMEDQLRQQGDRRATTDAPVTPAAPVTAVANTAPAPKRRRPTGARFGGIQMEESDTDLTQAVPAGQAFPSGPVQQSAAVRGARFGGIRPSTTADGPGLSSGPGPGPGPGPRESGPGAATPAPTSPPAPRSAAELAALAGRIGELHLRGTKHESAAVVAQAAVTLAPRDVARLAAALRARGPRGSAGYLARAAAHGPAEQAAGTLAELRQAGLTEEAAELFHALWTFPAAGLPTLLAALEATGQHADAHTLLWEWASAPPAELAHLAAELALAGRQSDVSGLLRQVAGRPVPDIAATVGRLAGPEGGQNGPQLALVLVRQTAALRSPGDVAALASCLTAGGGDASGPGFPALYEALLTAVAGQEESRSRAVLAAVRSAGLPTVPPTSARARGRR